MIINLEVNGRKLTFVCSSRNTRHGFAHDAEMYLDNCSVWKRAHCYYLNRTWESWRYQSVCLKACGEALGDRVEWLKSDFKDRNDITRLAGKRRAEFNSLVESDDVCIMFREAMNQLRNGQF